MSSGKTTVESLREWVEWESDNNLHAPENITKADERNFRSPNHQQDRELRYAAGRTWKELEEALDVAEAVERAERGEEVNFESYFEYTENNEKYSEDNVDNLTQLKDELGFEAADVTLFALKMTTAVQAGFGSESYEPNLEVMANALDSGNETEIHYEVATEEILELLDPNNEGELYRTVMEEDQDREEIAQKAEWMVERLSSMASTLPKESLENYVTEKIDYNRNQRDLENMDADHPNPEEEYKRELEK